MIQYKKKKGLKEVYLNFFKESVAKHFLFLYIRKRKIATKNKKIFTNIILSGKIKLTKKE